LQESNSFSSGREISRGTEAFLIVFFKERIGDDLGEGWMEFARWDEDVDVLRAEIDLGTFGLT